VGSHKKFPPEMRERAVRLVFEQQDAHESQWAAIVSIASDLHLAALSTERTTEEHCFQCLTT
jgi:hypothetical protein